MDQLDGATEKVASIEFVGGNVKEIFRAWYQRSPQELKKLWESAIFVPDANILLHCVRHSPEVREELLRIFEVLRESLWIPYQIGLEFQRHRLEVEGAALDAYDKLVKDYDAPLNQLADKLRQLRSHPSIDVERELLAIKRFREDFEKRIEAARVNHPVQAAASAVERLTSIFQGRVGAKPSPEKLLAMRKEGEDRYARKIPPGYMDAKKDQGESDKYGDLIIWKEMMEKGRQEKKPIIFVTDDAKEDWWRVHRGQKLGARPELLEEFRASAAQEFHIYQLGQFLRVAAEHHAEITQANVARIEKSVSEAQDAQKLTVVAEESLQRVVSLENERDQLINMLAGVPAANKMVGGAEDRAVLRARLLQINHELSLLKDGQEFVNHGPTLG